jgi:hypothetical protein
MARAMRESLKDKEKEKQKENEKGKSDKPSTGDLRGRVYPDKSPDMSQTSSVALLPSRVNESDLLFQSSSISQGRIFR